MQKRQREKFEIETADLDSLFLWKVFWKMMRSQSIAVFLLKVFAVAAFFLAFLFFFFTVGASLGA